MKIDNIKVNAFGNLEDKQIELSNNINIIKGNNESGKSTLLKFIASMFYGVSHNKRGKNFSDYDRFKPWSGKEYLGKMVYELDNGRKYEIFREFDKKSPKIYDEELNDISKEFTIDKTNGNMFFTEQTKVDEATFLSTFASMQTEVKLEKNEQNILIQKIANLAGTGEDNVSYKKALEKINKKQIEEIGTLRSSGRPINVVKEEQFKLQDEIGELEEFKDKRYEIEENKNNLESNIAQDENKLIVLKEFKQLQDEEKIEQEKINLNEKMINTEREKVNELKLQKETIRENIKEIEKINVEEKQIKKSKNSLPIIIFIITIILTIVFIKNIPVMAIFLGISIIDFIILITKIIKNRRKLKENENKIRKQKEEYKNKIDEQKNDLERVNTQIDLLEKSIQEKQEEIQNNKNILNIKVETKQKELTQKHKININLKDNISYQIDALQTQINNNKLQLHSLEIDKNNIMPKLEKMASMEERLQELNEKEQELLKYNESFELAKKVLELAYTKMKENITPKFTENLSKSVAKISNEKYKKVRINDEEGIIVEKENGEYVNAEKLSIGTIDQLYISLRFGAMKEISEESMPIILDEAFAYYDEERLKNVLTYISKEYENNQIIIFTCTNREVEILDKENIKYNLVNL